MKYLCSWYPPTPPPQNSKYIPLTFMLYKWHQRHLNSPHWLISILDSYFMGDLFVAVLTSIMIFLTKPLQLLCLLIIGKYEYAKTSIFELNWGCTMYSRTNVSWINPLLFSYVSCFSSYDPELAMVKCNTIALQPSEYLTSILRIFVN